MEICSDPWPAREPLPRPAERALRLPQGLPKAPTPGRVSGAATVTAGYEPAQLLVCWRGDQGGVGGERLATLSQPLRRNSVRALLAGRLARQLLIWGMGCCTQIMAVTCAGPTVAL